MLSLTSDKTSQRYESIQNIILRILWLGVTNNKVTRYLVWVVCFPSSCNRCNTSIHTIKWIIKSTSLKYSWNRGTRSNFFGVFIKTNLKDCNVYFQSEAIAPLLFRWSLHSDSSKAYNVIVYKICLQYDSNVLRRLIIITVSHQRIEFGCMKVYARQRKLKDPKIRNYKESPLKTSHMHWWVRVLLFIYLNENENFVFYFTVEIVYSNVFIQIKIRENYTSTGLICIMHVNIIL